MLERVVLELTPLCNLACTMCPRHYIDDNDGFMDSHLCMKLVNEALELDRGIKILPFWRGESALHPEFVELMSYALDRGAKIHISTNGHFMDSEHIDVFSRCEFVTFSIHSDLGYKNALKFLDKRDNSQGAIVQVSFVECEKTVEKYLKETIKHEKLNGFDSVRLYKEHSLEGEFGRSKVDSSKKRAFCPKLKDTFVVAYDGSFSRCNHIWETEKEFNLNDITLKEAWSHQRMQEIRRSYPDDKCLPCDQWSGHTNGEAWRMIDGKKEHIVYGL